MFDFFSISDSTMVMLVSMIPVLETRFAIPLAIQYYDMNWFWAIINGSLAGVLLTALLLNLLKFLVDFLSLISKKIKKIIDWWFDRVKKKFNERYYKYEFLALLFFVAIPFPGSGVWTGVAIAFIFGLPKIKSFLVISLGAVVASTLVALSTIGVLNIFN